MKNRFVFFMCLPLFLLLLLFIYIPFFKSFHDSLYNFKTKDFSGLLNYINVIKGMHKEVIANTIFYMIFSVILELLIACPLAYSMRKNFRGRGIIMAVLLLPWVTPSSVNGVIWKWIYDGNYGLLNDVLIHLHIISQTKVWMSDRLCSLLLIGIVHVWQVIPFMVLVFLSQLQKIPKEIFEAGKVDGLSDGQIFTRLIIPMLKGTVFLMLLQGGIFAIQIFDEIYVLTGASLDTRSLSIENYLILFNNFRVGQGTAFAFLVMLISTLPILLFQFLKKEKI